MSRGGGFLWQIDIFFATLKKKSLITFFSIVQKQGFFDSCILLSLESLGFFNLQLKRHSFDGMGPFLVKVTKSLGRLPLYESFGMLG